jgi:uncharacterized membrane protein YhhN
MFYSCCCCCCCCSGDLLLLLHPCCFTCLTAAAFLLLHYCYSGDFSFNYRLFNFANPPAVKLSTAAPIDPKDKKVWFFNFLDFRIKM